MDLNFPTGVRFHPTDEELVMHYLKRKVQGKRLEPELVAEVDIYQYPPEDLPERACLKKDLNWYFFSPIGKKYGWGVTVRTNRSTESGYWKATGTPRDVLYRQRTVGKVQTLVFYQGRPKKPERTDWVMHEYSLVDAELEDMGVSSAFVLCKIFKKGGMGPRNGEQYGAPYDEEEWDEEEMSNSAPTVPVVSASVVTDFAVTNASVVATSSVSANVYPLDTHEQVSSGAVSTSVVFDQPPTPTSDSAVINNASVVATSSVSANVYPLDTPEQVFSGAVSISVVDDQAPTPTSDPANVPVYIEGADQAPYAILEANPVPNYADGMYCAELGGEIYQDVEDLGFGLDDLDSSLFDWYLSHRG